MARKLFCEYSPFTYQLSVQKECLKRRVADLCVDNHLAVTKADGPLPYCVYEHQSLIRRTLGDVDMTLQENKATNLALAAPRVNGVLIRPGETFSFWKLVGSCTKRKGYKEGLIINRGKVSSGIGGGMCQFTNLLHWMVLHSPLQVLEMHHHNGLDLFPDFGRQVPFGVGTSVMYNYLDYRVKNNTGDTFQFLVHSDGTYLCGQLRCDALLPVKYHIYVADEFFSEEDGDYYRNNEVRRRCVEKHSGKTIRDDCVMRNHAKILYDISTVPPEKIRGAVSAQENCVRCL